MLIQLLRHFGDDDAQKIHGFTEGGEGEGRGGGTGFWHFDFRGRGQAMWDQRSVLRDQGSDLGFAGCASGDG